MTQFDVKSNLGRLLALMDRLTAEALLGFRLATRFDTRRTGRRAGLRRFTGLLPLTLPNALIS